MRRSLLLLLMILTSTIMSAQGEDSCTIDEGTASNCTDQSPIQVNVYEMTKQCWPYWCGAGDEERDRCNNCCELCCLYFFEVINNDPVRKVSAIGMCTDLGCSAAAGPAASVWSCVGGQLPWAADHICTFCGTTLTKIGVPEIQNAWAEQTVCGGPTYPGALCRENCIRFIPIITAYRLNTNDRLIMRVGLTGDCQSRNRPTDNGMQRRKCVWVCVKFDDGSEACCLVHPRHCSCTHAAVCDECEINDPNACTDEYAVGVAPYKDCLIPPPPRDNDPTLTNVRPSGGTVVPEDQ